MTATENATKSTAPSDDVTLLLVRTRRMTSGVGPGTKEIDRKGYGLSLLCFSQFAGALPGQLASALLVQGCKSRPVVTADK
jgi:hypothetical protein